MGMIEGLQQGTTGTTVPVQVDGQGVAAVATPTPAQVVTGQVKIAVTNTAVQLPSNLLKNGVVIKGKSTNTGKGFIGAAGVTTTDDGTGTGYAISAGEAMSFAVSNTNVLYINGTAGDVFYFGGN